MLNYLPRWLVIAVVLAVGIEQFAVRLPDVLLAWDTYRAKSAKLHSDTQTEGDKPKTAVERTAEAAAEKAPVETCQARMQLLTQNMFPDDFTDDMRVKPGTRTARMIAQYDKDCGQTTDGSSAATDSSTKQEALAAGVRAYQALKTMTLNPSKGPKFNDAQASMEAACVLGTRLTAPDVGDELSKKMVGESVQPCAQAVVAYKFILGSNIGLGSPHDLSKIPSPEMRSIWIADDLATNVNQCVSGNPGYAGFLSCTCAAGAEAGTRAISMPSYDAAKAISGATARCTTLSAKLAESDEPNAADTYLSALSLSSGKENVAQPAEASDLAKKWKEEVAKIRSLGQSGDYAAAFALAQELETEIENLELRTDGKAGAATAGELTSIAWWGLFAQEFQKSLDASDRSLSLRPGDLVALTNRAHALMFLGRDAEARDIYLAHRGEKVLDKTWERVILDDFGQLQKAGRIHPLMNEIAGTFGAGASTQPSATYGNASEHGNTVGLSALGLTLSPITPEARARLPWLQDQKGVLITDVAQGTPAANSRLKPGDLIVKVQQEAVASPADVREHVQKEKNAGRSSVLLLVQNGGDLRWAPLSVTAY